MTGQSHRAEIIAPLYIEVSRTGSLQKLRDNSHHSLPVLGTQDFLTLVLPSEIVLCGLNCGPPY